ncbi:nuclear transport factor 2 family protein [Fulvivirga maritima]|uniref:nuclear transport factor 2 family protein n=1 Tax=Fulvivirga maritima TaxID=2904247 RepID=UPI001F36E10A|nr:nuclear transport factor 2 family protein [Fulvivirga maritima]UII25093.1 nuclear transport factor 2 family protein [Fulvivirga maritima]
MKPKEVINKWVELFNQGNAVEISELYHSDAINHQVNQDPVEGKKAIEEMFDREFKMAEMVCIPENIFEDGEWAILEWKDPLGLRGCGFFKVINGKIKFQRGYWDKLSFLRIHELPLPRE